MKHETPLPRCKRQLSSIRCMHPVRGQMILLSRFFLCVFSLQLFSSCSSRPSSAVREKARAAMERARAERAARTPEEIALDKKMRDRRVQGWPQLRKGMTPEQVAQLIPVRHAPNVIGGRIPGPLIDHRGALEFIFMYSAKGGGYQLVSWRPMSKVLYSNFPPGENSKTLRELLAGGHAVIDIDSATVAAVKKRSGETNSRSLNSLSLGSLDAELESIAKKQGITLKDTVRDSSGNVISHKETDYSRKR